MASIQPLPLPPEALLARYAQSGAYTDCYASDIAHAVTHAAYVEAFYTSPIFKPESRLLAWFARKPSTDAQAHALATGQRDDFAAWKVEGRSADQLLLCDFTGRTRSWLMVAPTATGTRLYFGSAVVPLHDKATGRTRMGAGFAALLGFHRLYSRALLCAARRQLERGA